jgi:hypothetical protein
MTYQEKRLEAKIQEKMDKESILSAIGMVAMFMFVIFSGVFSECVY